MAVFKLYVHVAVKKECVLCCIRNYWFKNSSAKCHIFQLPWKAVPKWRFSQKSCCSSQRNAVLGHLSVHWLMQWRLSPLQHKQNSLNVLPTSSTYHRLSFILDKFCLHNVLPSCSTTRLFSTMFTNALTILTYYLPKKSDLSIFSCLHLK